MEIRQQEETGWDTAGSMSWGQLHNQPTLFPPVWFDVSTCWLWKYRSNKKDKMETVRREEKMCLALIKWSAVRWQTWTICAPDESCHSPQSVSDSSAHLLIIQYLVFLLFFILCLPSLVFWFILHKNAHTDTENKSLSQSPVNSVRLKGECYLCVTHFFSPLFCSLPASSWKSVFIVQCIITADV